MGSRTRTRSANAITAKLVTIDEILLSLISRGGRALSKFLE